MTEPLVYIIVVNWKNTADTYECLASLYKINYSNYKTVLVDNQTKFENIKIIKNKFPNTVIIRNKKNTGYCKANNQGIKYALKSGAKYILLLNNDTIVKHDFLTKLVNYAQKNNFRGILTPKILYYKSNVIWAMGGNIPIISSIPRMIGQGKGSEYCNSIIEADYAPGCALFINSEVLKEIGLLDEIYFAYYEDTDLCYRVKKTGHKVLAIPESVVWHKVSKSTNKITTNKINSIQSYYLSRNGIIFGVKNFRKLKRLFYLLAQSVIKLPLYLIIKCRGAKSKIAYLKGYFSGVNYIFNKNV